jgi:ABC-type branched-subunit amino acid transport system substrate-binding protein
MKLMPSLLAVTVTLVMLVVSHAQIIPVTEPTQDPSQVVAEAIVQGCNAALNDRVSRIKNLWETLWENERATPAHILAALGTNASKIFQAAALARADLEAIATLAGTTPTALLGHAKYLTPKLAITFHQDGRVTLTTP